MANKKQEKMYTLQEIKETFFPNRELKSLKQYEDNTLSKESFYNILKKVARPVDEQADSKS